MSVGKTKKECYNYKKGKKKLYDLICEKNQINWQMILNLRKEKSECDFSSREIA